MAGAVWQASILDEAGNVQPSASVEVRSEVTGNLATIYSDRDLTTPMANPATADANGFIRFFTVGGVYRITATKGGLSKEWRYVAIGLSAERDTEAARSQFTITEAGDVTLDGDSADTIFVNKETGEATIVYMPASADKAHKKQRIVDRKRDAATNNIKIRPAKAATVTMTIATPAVVTYAEHGLSAGDPISFSTTGDLPTGVSEDTIYYVLAADLATDTFKFSDSPGGSAIETSGSQSGTHSIHTETIMGGACYIIDSNGGSFEAEAEPGGTGWS